jgi:hypothetical protein
MTQRTAKQIIADLKEARRRRHQQRGELLLLSPPSSPMQVAREFVQQCCLYNNRSDELTLRYWRGGWWAWRTSHWAEVQSRAVRSLLYKFTEHAIYIDQKGPKPWAPTRRKIADLLEALGAIVILSDETDQPCWIDGRATGTIVAVANGLLDLTSRICTRIRRLILIRLRFRVPTIPARQSPNNGWSFSRSCGRRSESPSMCSGSGSVISFQAGSTCTKSC